MYQVFNNKTTGEESLEFSQALYPAAAKRLVSLTGYVS